ncbi:hypothetical protein HPB49_007678 [Dermacentor silvarum]|uniref:Uncharacterized protein n=1 Tax=Dermacentor silvarum TaxID=543639 RepID=A0ACB8DBU9_DERSI|nr:hypothetical protein HPB49_007678 [Dermacentor silvarum]
MRKSRQSLYVETEYEVNAYETAPHTACKGVIRRVDLRDNPATITKSIVHDFHPLALAAKRIKSTGSIIVLFDGLRVPNYVRYGSTFVRYYLYRKQFDVTVKAPLAVESRKRFRSREVQVRFEGGGQMPGNKMTSGTAWAGKVKCIVTAAESDAGLPVGDSDVTIEPLIKKVTYLRKANEELTKQAAELGKNSQTSSTKV